MATYSVDSLFGYSAYAKRPTGKYTSPNTEPYKNANTGDFLGIIYSYIIRDGVLWIQLDNHGDGVYKTCFVKFTDIDTNKLKSAGVKSDAQLQKDKEQANMPWYERLITKYGVYFMIGLAFISALPVIIKSAKKR